MTTTSPVDASISAPPAPVPEASAVAASEHLLRSVGNTPLVELAFDELPRGTRLFAKLESCNPGASIKDRPVLRMLSRARSAGHFRGGRRLLDSSSGNAGIAYAQFGAAFGVPVTLVVPGNASRERLERIRAHGAELVLTDPIEGYDFAVMTARRLAEAHPDRYWYSDQYSNDDNWRAHYETTGQEILAQTQQVAGGPPDAFIAGVGTGGTITGVGRRLRQHAPDVHITTIVPEIFPGIEGLKPLGQPNDFVPEILDEDLIDHRIEVTIDQALAMSRRLARRGLFVGPSSGGYVHAALEVAASRRYPTVVTVLSDSGERYGSTGMWETEGE
ncbi:MAG: PLP-dependent cysteine synthase family protein [Acidobacteriota bacterium]